MNAIRDWVTAGLDLVYPRHCVGCSHPMDTSRSGYVCALCEQRVPVIEPPFCYKCGLPFDGEAPDVFTCEYCKKLDFIFERTVCACRAAGIVRDMLIGFKYNGQMQYGAHLAGWLIRSAQKWISWRDVDLIVPVPLHPRKKRHRQFNQAEYLALALSKVTGTPVRLNLLRRVKDTETQTRLDADQRAVNMRHAFALRDGAKCDGQRAVLLDDVFTTGATLNSCASLLAVAGAKRIIALTLARGI